MPEANILLEEDFSSASGSTSPPGWTVDVLEGNPETDLWRFDNPGNRSFLGTYLDEPYAIYDSDALSDDDVEENVAFVSPTFDASAAPGVFLTFDQVYGGIAGGENASEVFVEASTDGTTWEAAYSSNTGGFDLNPPIIDLTDELAGSETAQIRYRFDGNWSYLWGIDNVEIVDFLEPGVALSTGFVGVSEDNVPDPLDFSFALQSRPESDVTLDFFVDETQLEPIESLTFTPDNWFETQTSTVSAIADGIDEGVQTSSVSVQVSSDDPTYESFAVEDVEVQITDSVIPGYTSYRTVEKTFEDLSQLAADNPDIASWVDIGDSYDKATPGGPEGYDIFALNLTNKSTDSPTDKPVFFVEAAIHAREYTTTELVTRFAEDLVSGYGKDADITWLLNYADIHIVPVVNPDGRKFAEQGYSWRKNTNPNPPPGEEPAPFPLYGVDLNRNYDSKWGEVPGGSSGDPASAVYRGEAPFSEPEPQALRDYLTELFPDQRGEGDFDAAPPDTTGVYLDVHSYGNLVLYPFGWTEEPAPNREGLRNLGLKFGYFTGLDGEAYDVQQAIGLYPTDGTTDDWVYEEFGVASYTIELGTEFFEETDYFENTIVPEFTPALFYGAKSAYRPYQTSAGPDSIDLSLETSAVVAGMMLGLSAIADSTRYDDGNLSSDGITEGLELPEFKDIAGARYSIDAPSWVEGTTFFDLSAADGSFDSTVETLTGSIDTTGLSAGRHTLFIESQDTDGSYGVPTALFFDVLEKPAGSTDLVGSDDDETIVGNDGPNVIEALGGDDIVAGKLAADIIYGGDGDDVLRGEQNTRASGGSVGGDDLIYGGAGDDRLGGKGGNDSLYGDAGNDDIWGDDGDDILWGGLGDDTLTGDDFSGGSGSDTFVLAKGEGTDTITDFELGIDFIGLAGTLSFGQLSIAQEMKDTLISFGDETLAILNGVTADGLTENSFVPV